MRHARLGCGQSHSFDRSTVGRGRGPGHNVRAALRRTQRLQDVRRQGQQRSDSAACTRAIDLGKYKGTDIAALHTVRGMAVFGAGQIDSALSDQNQAIKIAPKDPLGYFSRAYIYRAKGDDDRALADFTQAIVLNRKSALARNFRGNIYLDKDDYNRAIVDYTEAIKLRPTLASAHASRGHARRGKGEHDRAIADYTQAIKLNPG